MPASPRIALVDYGSGNLRSVAKALARSGLEPDVTADPSAIVSADGVVLPGVGAFADCAGSLAGKNLVEAMRRAVDAGKPYLGLCLGLQLLFEQSDEHGSTPGFGWLPGRVERFSETADDGSARCVPHIGWNTVRFTGDHPMLEGLPSEDVYYFVHSYRVVTGDAAQVVGVTDYGGPFPAAVASGGIFAVQFHPEKSQNAGRRLLDAYAGWVASC